MYLTSSFLLVRLVLYVFLAVLYFVVWILIQKQYVSKLLICEHISVITYSGVQHWYVLPRLIAHPENPTFEESENMLVVAEVG